MDAPRWVIIDDNDPEIQYKGGPWIKAQPDELDGLGNWGKPFLGTSHGVNENSNFSYTFSGELNLSTHSTFFLRLASRFQRHGLGNI
jgi:hypothetical protein